MITLCSFCQGMTSDLSLYVKCCVREGFVAVLDKVHLLCWRFIVVRHGGHVHQDVDSILFPASAAVHSFSNLVSRGYDDKGLDSVGSLWRSVSDEHPLFQKRVFKASSIGIYFTNILILSVAFPFSGVIKCRCCTIATKFSQAAQQYSHDLCRFFPRGCTFSMVTTIACCPCHLVRVTSTFAVGRVAKFARRWLPMLLCCSTAHCGFSHMRMISFLLCLAVLPTCYLVHDSCLLGLTLVVVTGFPGHARGWHLRTVVSGQPVSIFLSSDVGLCRFLEIRGVGTCLVASGCPWVISLQAVLKCEGFASASSCFWVVPHSMSLHRTRPFILCTLGSARSVLRLGALRISRQCGSRFDDPPQGSFVVWWLCTNVFFF